MNLAFHEAEFERTKISFAFMDIKVKYHSLFGNSATYRSNNLFNNMIKNNKKP